MHTRITHTLHSLCRLPFTPILIGGFWFRWYASSHCKRAGCLGYLVPLPTQDDPTKVQMFCNYCSFSDDELYEPEEDAPAAAVVVPAAAVAAVAAADTTPAAASAVPTLPSSKSQQQK